MTASVKRGIDHLIEFGRCWLEADEGQVFEDDEQGLMDANAAIDWFEAGGRVGRQRRSMDTLEVL